MAVTAKFLADFTDFQTAVQKAEVSLRSFETGAGSVEKSLNKMADSFSGRKIVADAELATKAVIEIGGATKLTENEQVKLNAQLTEALAKYKALGLQAPDDMVKLANETKKVEAAMGTIPPQTTSLLSGLGKIASAVGIGFSIGAVVSFGKSVFDSASKIGDLATQLGISTDAVQGFKFAAEQSGSSLDAVGSAITKMNVMLGTGDDSTKAALRSVGLSFDDLRKMSPEEAFLAITDALKKTENQAQLTKVGTMLLGKGFAELIPAIRDGFRDVSDSASKMGTETVKNLKAAQDAWAALGAKVTIISADIISDTITATTRASRSWGDFFRFLSPLGLRGVSVDSFLADAAEAAAKLPSQLKPATNALVETTEEQKKAAEEAKKHAAALKELHDAITPLTEDQQKLVTSLMRGGASAEQIAKAYKLSATAIQKFFKDIDDAATQSLADWTDVVRRHQEEQRRGEEDTVAALKKLDEERVDAGRAAMDEWNDAVRHNQDVQRKAEAETLEALKKNAKASKAALGDLSQALAELAQISGTAFGGMVSSLATLVGAANTAQKAIALMRKSGEEKGSLAGILDMASGITGMVSAAIAAGKAVAALFALFDRNKGRDAVVDFAESFGGFDALHVKLLELGDAGEALWIKLTQGVGRNNPEQAQRVIDEVTAALEKQESQQDDTTDATEEQAQATIETATEAAKALDELGGKLDMSRDQWKDWGRDVTGVLDDVARSVRGLPIPTPSIAPSAVPGFASGTHGKFLDFGTGRDVRLHGKEKVVTEGEESRQGGGGMVVLELDRHVMARILVPAIADEVRRVRLS